MNFSKIKAIIFSLSFITILFLLIYALNLNILIPHEDAAITLDIAKNLSERNIFTYGNSNIPIEGSVDFLWVVIISFFTKLGFDSYYVALLITLSSLLGLLRIFQKKAIFKKKGIIFFTLIFIFLNPFIWSGIAGFSSVFFSFLIVSVIYFYENKDYKFFWILSLFTILTRPDGIVCIITPILIKIFSLRRNNISEIKYILIVSIVGIIYFVSRFLYFENFFPLPFYVKTNFNLLSFDSIVKYSFVLIPLIISTIFFKKDINQNFIKRILIFISIPIIFYSFNSLSQNYANRFFAPLFFGILYILLTYNVRFCKFFLIISFIFNFYFTVESFLYLTASKNETIYNISQDIKFLEGNVLTTEAGRISYYTKNLFVEDAWGITNPKYAKKIITSKDLSKGDFDFAILHCDINNLNKKNLKDSTLRSWKNMCNNITKFLNSNLEQYSVFLVPFRLTNENSLYSIMRSKYKEIKLKAVEKKILSNFYLAGYKGCKTYLLFVVDKNYNSFKMISNILAKYNSIDYKKNNKIKDKIKYDVICK